MAFVGQGVAGMMDLPGTELEDVADVEMTSLFVAVESFVSSRDGVNRDAFDLASLPGVDDGEFGLVHAQPVCGKGTIRGGD